MIHNNEDVMIEKHLERISNNLASVHTRNASLTLESLSLFSSLHWHVHQAMETSSLSHTVSPMSLPPFILGSSFEKEGKDGLEIESKDFKLF